MQTREVIIELECEEACDGHATTEILQWWRDWLRAGRIVGLHEIIRTAPLAWRIRSTWKVV